MSKDNQTPNSFGKLVGQLQGILLAVIGFVSTVVGFVNLAKGNAGLVTLILIAIGISLFWLACLYFARFWKPEKNDGKESFLSFLSADKEVKKQKKKEQRRKLVRRTALIGVFIVPLLTISSWGAWVHMKSLPSDNVVILIAEFDGPNSQNNRVTETILSQLRDVSDKYDEVKIVALGQTVTEQMGSEEARKIAEKKKADIMIWGWYGKSAEVVPISVNFEVMETDEYTPEDLGDSANGAVQVFAISELNTFKLQTRLSDEMSYLTLFTLGLANYADDDWDEAIAKFSDAITYIDESTDRFNISLIHFYKGSSYLFKNEHELAIYAFNQALSITPSYPQALSNKGKALSDLGYYNDAIVAYDKALSVQPDYYEALNNKAAVLIKIRRYREAIVVLNGALGLQPENHYALNNQGNALAGLGRYDEAIAAFDQAIKIKPAFHISPYNKGVVLTSLGRYDEAIEAFDQAIKIKPNYYEALHNKGAVLTIIGRVDEAITTYDQILKADPDNYESLLGKSAVLIGLGRFDEAITIYDKILEANSEDQYALLGKSGALANSGQFDEAIAIYDKILEANSEDQYALLGKGGALTNSGQFDEAIAIYDKILNTSDKNQYAIYGKSRIYSLAGDTENALRWLERAINLDNNIRNTVKADNAFNSIQHDPRFQKLIGIDS